MTEKERIADEMRPFPEAVAIVRALRGARHQVGVLTNGPSEFQRRKLEVSGLGPELDAIAISEELGVAKPEREAFERRSSSSARARGDGDGRRLARERRAGAIDAGLAAVVWMPGGGAATYRPARIWHGSSEVPRLLGLAK